MASVSAGAGSSGFHAMIRYELAEEMLTLLRTDSGRRLRRAQARNPADTAKVARSAEAHASYVELHAILHRLSAEEIEEIISDYGPLARAAAGTTAP